MFGLPIGLLVRIGITIALAVAVAYATHMVLEHFRQEGRNEIQAKWDADKAERIKRTTEIVLDYVAKEAAADDAAQKRRALLDADFAPLESRLARISPNGVLHFSSASARLLDDASRAANADRAALATIDGGGKASARTIPDATVLPTDAELIVSEREWDAFELKTAHAYRDAFQVWEACRMREDVCRAKIDNLVGGN